MSYKRMLLGASILGNKLMELRAPKAARSA